MTFFLAIIRLQVPAGPPTPPPAVQTGGSCERRLSIRIDSIITTQGGASFDTHPDPRIKITGPASANQGSTDGVRHFPAQFPPF